MLLTGNKFGTVDAFLTIYPLGEINPNQENTSEIPKITRQHGIVEKIKTVSAKCFNIANWIVYLDPRKV